MSGDETTRIDAEVFVIMNEDGEYVASEDEDHVGERADEYVRGHIRRKTKLTLSMQIPKTHKYRAELPDTGEDAEHTLTIE